MADCLYVEICGLGHNLGHKETTLCMAKPTYIDRSLLLGLALSRIVREKI